MKRKKQNNPNFESRKRAQQSNVYVEIPRVEIITSNRTGLHNSSNKTGCNVSDVAVQVGSIYI